MQFTYKWNEMHCFATGSAIVMEMNALQWPPQETLANVMIPTMSASVIAM